MKPEDNDAMCRVNPGWPMHDLLKQYWVPVARAESLAPGGAPHALTMFGERYVVFRSPDGTLGMFDEACPHRGASLALARNEDCGLRCIFHGWLFSPDGKTLEIPSEPAESTYKDRVKFNHYPVQEYGDIVWAYLGGDTAPHFPEYGFGTVPKSHRMVMKAEQNCNWVQVLEGNIDSSHVSMLHSSQIKKLMESNEGDSGVLEDSSPAYDVDDTKYGFKAAAIRTLKDGRSYVRVSEYIAPWCVLVAATDEVDRIAVFTIPNDDYTTTFWFVIYNHERPLDDTQTHGLFQRTVGPNPDNFRETFPAENMWGQDREAMAEGHWSGIDSLYFEDIAVQESSGKLMPRTNERLGSSDRAVNRMRRWLLGAPKRVADGELLPDPAIDYTSIEALEVFLEPGVDWKSVKDA